MLMSCPLQREFQRFSGTLQHESRTLPLKNDAEAKGAEIKAALSANKSEVLVDVSYSVEGWTHDFCPRPTLTQR